MSPLSKTATFNLQTKTNMEFYEIQKFQGKLIPNVDSNDIAFILSG